jgi:hypothetical protein
MLKGHLPRHISQSIRVNEEKVTSVLAHWKYCGTPLTARILGVDTHTRERNISLIRVLSSSSSSSSFILLMSLKLSDTKVYEPQIRALIRGWWCRPTPARSHSNQTHETSLMHCTSLPQSANCPNRRKRVTTKTRKKERGRTSLRRTTQRAVTPPLQNRDPQP